MHAKGIYFTKISTPLVMLRKEFFQQAISLSNNLLIKKKIVGLPKIGVK